MAAKKARLDAGDRDAFIQRGELGAYVSRSQQAFDEELARQKAGGKP